MMHTVTSCTQFVRAPEMKYVEFEPGGLTERYNSRTIKTSVTFVNVSGLKALRGFAQFLCLD